MKQFLNESSLNRIRQTMLNHDTGLITAFRHEFKREQNLERNKDLLTDLRRYYNVTSIQGSYIENYGSPFAKEVKEISFFVSDPNDVGALKFNLIRLGKKYGQDSILFIPKGASEGLLIGTKKDSYPGLGVEQKLNHPVFGKDGEFMTKVKGRPFIFLEESKISHYEKDGPLGFFGEWARYVKTCKYDKK